MGNLVVLATGFFFHTVCLDQNKFTCEYEVLSSLFLSEFSVSLLVSNSHLFKIMMPSLHLVMCIYVSHLFW